jgi:hypothetical protein
MGSCPPKLQLPPNNQQTISASAIHVKKQQFAYAHEQWQPTEPRAGSRAICRSRACSVSRRGQIKSSFLALCLVYLCVRKGLALRPFMHAKEMRAGCWRLTRPRPCRYECVSAWKEFALIIKWNCDVTWIINKFIKIQYFITFKKSP